MTTYYRNNGAWTTSSTGAYSQRSNAEGNWYVRYVLDITQSSSTATTITYKITLKQQIKCTGSAPKDSYNWITKVQSVASTSKCSVKSSSTGSSSTGYKYSYYYAGTTKATGASKYGTSIGGDWTTVNSTSGTYVINRGAYTADGSFKVNLYIKQATKNYTGDTSDVIGDWTTPAISVSHLAYNAVSFNANGGSGTVPSTIYAYYGRAITWPSTTCYKSGYALLGYGSSGATTATYKVGSSYTYSTNSTASNTVYMIWSAQDAPPLAPTCSVYSGYLRVAQSYNSLNYPSDYEVEIYSVDVATGKKTLKDHFIATNETAWTTSSTTITTTTTYLLKGSSRYSLTGDCVWRVRGRNNLLYGEWSDYYWYITGTDTLSIQAYEYGKDICICEHPFYSNSKYSLLKAYIFYDESGNIIFYDQTALDDDSQSNYCIDATNLKYEISLDNMYANYDFSQLSTNTSIEFFDTSGQSDSTMTLAQIGDARWDGYSAQMERADVFLSSTSLYAYYVYRSSVGDGLPSADTLYVIVRKYTDSEDDESFMYWAHELSDDELELCRLTNYRNINSITVKVVEYGENNCGYNGTVSYADMISENKIVPKIYGKNSPINVNDFSNLDLSNYTFIRYYAPTTNVDGSEFNNYTHGADCLDFDDCGDDQEADEEFSSYESQEYFILYSIEGDWTDTDAWGNYYTYKDKTYYIVIPYSNGSSYLPAVCELTDTLHTSFDVQNDGSNKIYIKDNNSRLGS